MDLRKTSIEQLIVEETNLDTHTGYNPQDTVTSLASFQSVDSNDLSFNNDSIQQALNPPRGTITVRGTPKKYWQWPRELLLKFMVVGLAIVIIAGTALIWYYYDQGQLTVTVAGAVITVAARTLEIKNTKNNIGITISIATHVPEYQNPWNCWTDSQGVHSACLEFSTYSRFTLKYWTMDNAKCYDVAWQQISPVVPPEDCIQLDDVLLYGGGQTYEQKWPVSRDPDTGVEFLSTHIHSNTSQFGSILGRFWLFSSGLVLIVNESTPLIITQRSETMMCLKAGYDSVFELPSLLYTVCAGNDAKSIFQATAERYVGLATHTPDLELLENPVWSTSGYFWEEITQASIEDFAGEIAERQFPHSLLIIDSKYEEHYGDFDFDPVNFERAPEMISQLHDFGFSVSLRLTPYINTDSPCFQEGLLQDVWILDNRALSPGLVKWWLGIAAVIDFTKPNAIDWLATKITNLRNYYGVDGFKMDGGEVGYLPTAFSTSGQLVNSNVYSTLYTKVAETFGNKTVISVGYNSQDSPVLFSMMDREPVWGYNGLRALIPTALTLSVLGYPLFLPTMIGGNRYFGFEDASRGPSEIDIELYIRWMQVEVFLPTMHFSTPPWSFGSDTVVIARAMVQLHADVVYPAILAALTEYRLTRAPVIRPLWWLEPGSNHDLCDSEFLVGGRILVAPVLELGARSRDVYLPAGTWRDELHNEVYHGARTITGLSVQLNEVLYFTLEHAAEQIQ